MKNYNRLCKSARSGEIVSSEWHVKDVVLDSSSYNGPLTLVFSNLSGAKVNATDVSISMAALSLAVLGLG